MAVRVFYAIDSEALSVVSSAVQVVGDSIINNSDSPDGTQYVFTAGHLGTDVTINDSGGGSLDTLEDDAGSNHVVTDGGGLIAGASQIEAESTIQLQALDGLGFPTGPIINVMILSKDGDPNAVWGFASDTPLVIGTTYEKVGGADIGTADYADLAVSPDGIIDGTNANDTIGSGDSDAQNDFVDGPDGNDDMVFGYGGSDDIDGGVGNDTIFGDDDIGIGNLPPAPGDYDDSIDGGAGDDFIDAGYGADTVTGGTGADTLIGGQGSDSIDGNDEADVIFGDFATSLADLGSGTPGDSVTLDYALNDGSGNVAIDFADFFTGGAPTASQDVEFYDDWDPGADPISNLVIDRIGNSGAGDEDVLRFDLSQYNDDFRIQLNDEGTEDRIVFTNATSATLDAAGDTIITYMGSDGVEQTVVLEKTLAQIEVLTGTTAADFSGDGDTINAGAGNDFIDGGFGSDLIDAGDGDDTIMASTGADTITGGIGTDIYDATGSTTLAQDTLTVVLDANGDGTAAKSSDGSTDTLSNIERILAAEAAGEADSLTLTGVELATNVTGMSDGAMGFFTSGLNGQSYFFGGVGEPTINDILSGTFDPGTGPVAPVGSFTITSGEEDGAQVGKFYMENFETINFNTTVCFGRGTQIETDRGEVAIEDLCEGDLVKTMDHGLQPIRYICSTTVPAKGALAPILIKKGALGNTRDLRVSPQHRMMLQGWQMELLFAEPEVLVPAKHLINDHSIRRAEGGLVEYFHMLFDSHEIVFAEAVPSESFHPGAVGIDSLAEPSRAELFELFPQLRDNTSSYGPSARCTLKEYEARILVADTQLICH